MTATASVSSGQTRKGGQATGGSGMPWLRRTARPGERVSGRAGGGRFSPRTRVIAGALAALAVLAVLAVAVLAGSGGPAPVRAASGATRAAGSRAGGPGRGATRGAQPSPSGAANPTPPAPPTPTPAPAPPPVDPALTLGRPGAPVTIVEFGDYQCTNCGAFARDTEPALVRQYADTG